MEELQLYFDPVDISLFPDNFRQGQIGAGVVFHLEDSFPDPETIQIAIFGVPENRASAGDRDASFAADAIRPFFYTLQNHFQNVTIADLGNLKTGMNPEDTYEAVSEVVSQLLHFNVVPVILGGSQDLTYANYLAYEKRNRIINILSVDSRFDIGKSEEAFNNESWLNRIIFRDPNFLFNFSNLGYQTYFVEQEAVSLMKKLFFDANRLGMAKAELTETEPLIRNADLISFDMSAIRMSDCPAASFPSANGFNGEDACQIMRYAGLSEKLSSIGLYELCPANDRDGLSARLAAQMIWYFLDGFAGRKGDDPHMNKTALMKYIVSMHETQSDISFYRSPVSDRWWMEVPCPKNLFSKFERHYMVPCSYRDYEEAMQENLPDRWWQTFQKFM
ncbi:Formimidoylglutamase [bioreactor metagenome]|uniref:Formimidoylglutamase n=1 Tax=bioreactor metagenome TaxID=1076179 RepID=A0A644WQT6_9ZZZZ